MKRKRIKELKKKLKHKDITEEECIELILVEYARLFIIVLVLSAVLTAVSVQTLFWNIYLFG